MTGEHTTSVGDSVPDRFDVREFARTAVGSYRSEIDLEAFAARPLEPATVRVLATMRELERSTMTYLRNVLVTPTHKDARVTAFLTTWAFEKFWIADSFEAIARAHGLDVTEPLPLSRFRGLALELAERATPIVESFRANSIGPDVIGLHMASVTIDEWITESAYTKLAEIDPHPVLLAVLDHVQEVKKRHRLFVEVDAVNRLESSPRARSLSRRSLPRAAWPIGAASLPKSETAFFYETLIDDALAVRIDEKVQGLPGLEKLRLVRTARAKALRGGSTPTATTGRWLGRAAATAKNALPHSTSTSPSNTTAKTPTTTTTTTTDSLKGGPTG
ncbi:hypothetical protein [Herbiconiux sp.]|uniref:hypothetical protein n=1 Tax=Herbiconiux sp. TaxID=1871186 RepID=UPI0025BBE088|nr:hypothetical protein [Herbiconiux sp.]